MAVQTGTGLGHILSLLALAKGGMAIAPIDRTFMSEEIVYQINDGGAKAFISDNDIYSKKIEPIRDRLPTVSCFIGIGPENTCEYDFEALINEGSGQEPDVTVS